MPSGTSNPYPYPVSTTDNTGPYTIAVLPLSGTTVTATAVPSTTGLVVVDGTTISFRADGITLSDGQVFSLGFNGLVDSSTTGTYRAVSTLQATTPSVRYDATRHPTSAITVIDGDESTFSIDVSPTETTSRKAGDIPLTSSDQQVSTLISASTTVSVVDSTVTTGTATRTISGSGATTTTGGSLASHQRDMASFGSLVVVLLSMFGILGL